MADHLVFPWPSHDQAQKNTWTDNKGASDSQHSSTSEAMALRRYTNVLLLLLLLLLLLWCLLLSRLDCCCDPPP